MRTQDTEAWVKVFDDVLLDSKNRRKRLKMSYGSPAAPPNDVQNLRDSNSIVDCFVYAIKQSRRSAKYEHLKAARQERVSLFVTDLRRAITGLSMYHKDTKANFVTDLCRKDLWHDIAVLNPNSRSFHPQQIFTREKLSSWLQQAWAEARRSPEDDIQLELNELRAQMSVVDDIIRTAAKINADAEPVVDGLIALEQEIG